MDIAPDVRYAWRLVMRHRVISACAIASIGLCASAAALCFGFLDGAERTRLPYSDPERLVHLVRGVVAGSRSAQPDYVNRTVPLDLARSVTSGSRTLQQVAFMGMPVSGTIPDASGPLEVVLRGVSPSMFAVLGRAPVLGRTFGWGDGGADRPRVAVLSHSGWRTRFGGDSTVAGRGILCQSVIYTVIGVMPPGIEGDEKVDGWIPIDQMRSVVSARTDAAGAPVWIIARMAPAATLQGVQRELDLRMQAVSPTLPVTERGYRVDAISMRTFMYPAFLEQTAWFVYAAVGILVVVTVLSLSLLVLARDIGRAPDLVVQASLGASVWRLVRPYALESLIVGGVAAGFGTALAEFLYARLRGTELFEDRWWVANGVSVRAIGVGVGLALGMSLLSVLLAAHRAANVEMSGRNPYAAGGFSPGMHNAGARIVAAEIALSIVMLSLLGASAFRVLQLARLDIGFDPGRVVRVIAPGAFPSVRSGPDWHGAVGALEAELLGVPGVVAVGVVQVRSDTSARIVASGGAVRELSGPGDGNPLLTAYASPQFFAALQIRLARGRLIANEEDAAGAPVAILSRKAAAVLFPARDPIGLAALLMIGDQRRPLTVVGVVEDVNLSPAQHLLSPPTVYSPAVLDPARPPVVLARGSVPARDLAPAISQTLTRRYGGATPSAFPFADAFASWSETQRLPFRAIAPIVMVALMAALLGMFAVVSDAIGRRMRELGIRAALGASPLRNAGLIVRSVGGSLGLGLCLGVGLTLLIARPFAQVARLGEVPGWVPVVCGLSFLPAAALAVLKPIVRAVAVAPAQLLREL